MSNGDEPTMTSGAFARRSRLSPKALRLYDDMGLLRPAWVDPSNGYRYYDESQIEPARLIGLLRTLGMPLATISEVVLLDAPDAITAIGTFWEGVEAQHTGQKKRLVRHLAQLLSGKGHDMYRVEQRDVPAQRVASIEERVLAGELPAFIDRSMRSLCGHLEQSAATMGIPFVAYHGEVNLDSDGPVEVCIPYDGTLEPIDQLRLRLEPAHREAFTRITKQQVEFPVILEAYEAVESWVRSNGHAVSGSPREVYFVDFDAAADHEPACDIAFPYD